MVKNANKKNGVERCQYSIKLRTFRKIGVVKKSGILKKLESKRFDTIFVGYREKRGANVFRMLNLDTRKIVVTRDIKWLNINYEQWCNKNKLLESEDSESSIDQVHSTGRDEEAQQRKHDDNDSSTMIKNMIENTEDCDSKILMTGNNRFRFRWLTRYIYLKPIKKQAQERIKSLGDYG